MEQTCLAFVVTCLIAVEAAFPPENYHYCSDVLSENQTHAERCEKIESCLEIYTANNFQNGIYFRRGTSDNEALDQYCNSQREFDESLQDSCDYIKETGCSSVDNELELITDGGQILVTTELWDQSRVFLRSMNDIVCSRIKLQLACPRPLRHDYIWSFVGCLRDIHPMYIDMRPKLVQMLVAGPGKYIDRQMFCRSVMGLEDCVYYAVMDACSTTRSERHAILGELITHAKSVWDIAGCNGMPLHSVLHTF